MQMEADRNDLTARLPYLCFNEIPNALKNLRSHRQSHAYGGECGCGEHEDYCIFCGQEASVNNCGTSPHRHMIRRLAYLTLQEEAKVILAALNRQIAEVKELVAHRCSHRLSDNEEYFLPCGICGSDGNA